MTDDLEEYILRHIDDESELLSALNRETHLYHLRPRMISGHLQGRILKMFCRMIRPHRILELGTFTGYSALCLAEGMPEDAELHTIDVDDEIEEFISMPIRGIICATMNWYSIKYARADSYWPIIHYGMERL